MKKSVSARTLIASVPFASLICISLLLTSQSFAADAMELRLPNHADDSIVIQKQITSKKHKIKLFTNASQEVLFFSANGEEGKIYQLFMFDVDGKLVKQVNIKHKQTTVINKIERGIYLFEVFSNDERIENGQVFVK